MAVIVNIALNAKADADILDWLREQPNRSAAVRAAIRSHIAKSEGVTLAEVLAEIRSLPSKLSVVTVNPEPVEEGEEPEAAAANLNGLLGRLGNGDMG